MKTPKNKIMFLVSVTMLCVLTSLCGILICESNLPYMTKYSFSMLLLAALCFLLLLMIKFYERIAEHLNGNSMDKNNEEFYAVKNELEMLKAQKVQREVFTVNDTETLCKKCETVENFRNSFPYSIADDYVIYNIMRTELRVSEYSRWQLVGEFQGELWEYTLLRPDIQSFKEMLNLVAATSMPSEIEKLNIGEKLLWN